MIDKKKAPGSAATLTGAGREAAAGMAHNSYDNFTSADAGRQGRIFSLLLEGEENALSAADLATLAGYKNQRSMRMAIDREREQGLLVLASEAGYFRPAAGSRGVMEVRRFIRRQDARATSNRKTTRKIREYLRSAEKAPLEGQENFWNEGDV